MKVIMGVIAIGLLAVMALKYGAYLAAGSTDAMANVDSMKRSIAARNEAMSELGGPAAMPVEAAPPPATVSPSPTPSSFDRMFSTEAMQQGGGVATFNAVPKTKCEELAKKWGIWKSVLKPTSRGTVVSHRKSEFHVAIHGGRVHSNIGMKC